jgi:hypothetical protein
LGTQVYAYLYETSYGGNRFSLNLADAIGSAAGPRASGLWPGLILVLWVAGMALALSELFKATGRKVPLPGLLLAGCGVAFFVLSLTPNLSQSFYWRSALFTYLLPMTVNTYLTAFVLNRLRHKGNLAISAGLVLIFAFFAAGFSETVTALEIGIYALVFAAGSFALFRKVSWSRRLSWLAGAALIGALLALVVLVLSPANHIRQQSLPPPPGFAALVRMSLYNAYIFLRISFSKHLGVLTLAGLAFLAVSYLTSAQPAKINIPRLAARITAALAAIYLLVVCVVAPSAYGESSYPDLRALIAAWWVLVAGIGTLGWMAGEFLAEWAAASHLTPKTAAAARFGAAIVLLALCALPIIIAFQTYAQLPRYQKWAAFWDTRDAQLWQDSRANVSTAEVIQLDHIIQDVGELSPQPTFWYNVCAARYYGVKQIVADLPGWDK